MRYFILFGCAFLYYVTCMLYDMQHCSPIIENDRNCLIYSQMFSLGIHIIIVALHFLPIAIKHGDRIFNVWVWGMISYLFFNNIINEGSELICLIMNWKNRYSPYVNSIDKEIIFIGIMAICTVRVWYLKRVKKVWGSSTT